MKKIIKSTLIFSLLIISFYSLNAQPGGGGDGGTPNDPGDNPVPITGIEYLIAAGAAFGAKKIYDKKKK
ncbi:MAG: PID-CTERM protein-sorting domain-containing protein [Bacteroidota bacterium]